MIYTESYQARGNAAYRQTADEIFAYVQRDMTTPEGGFCSAEDADSEGEEGVFYVWTITAYLCRNFECEFPANDIICGRSFLLAASLDDGFVVQWRVHL